MIHDGKEYVEVEFYGGQTIEQAVRWLLEYKEKGVLACGVFNTVTLYSDTVTLDSAYKEITGKSKVEVDADHRRWIEDAKRAEEEHKKAIPALTKIWRHKGREVLAEDKWDKWDEIVPIRLNDLYHGMELGNCLDVVKILNNGGSFDEAEETLANQGHSGMSYSLVCSMVMEFCDRGKDFFEYVN